MSSTLLSDSVLAAGGYAGEQLFSRSKVIAWSHRRRFAAARRLLAPYQGGRLLDYGCGDGTLLFLVRDLFPQAIGVDIDPKHIDSCRRRFGPLTQLAFTTAVSDVRSYSRTHGMLYQWRFLTGSLPELKRVWRAYGIDVQIERDQIDHTPALCESSGAGSRGPLS